MKNGSGRIGKKLLRMIVRQSGEIICILCAMAPHWSGKDVALRQISVSSISIACRL
jgi:hypothetical protein